MQALLANEKFTSSAQANIVQGAGDQLAAARGRLAQLIVRARPWGVLCLLDLPAATGAAALIVGGPCP